ncbi:MAG TPA: PHB depolymerase family esterase [Chloroflexota bacterium]|nr:PHB depolymerase family esterase [Chloroflexota bacterium]
MHHEARRPIAGEAPHPALILLHGRGADERDLLPLAHQLDPRLFVVSARAPFRFGWGGYVWYDLAPQGVGYPDPATLDSSMRKVRAFLGEVTETYPLDRSRIYLGGFSNGATLAGVLALTDPDLVAGAAVLSGYLPVHSDLPYRPDAAAGHPFFEGHGVADQVIPIMWARAGKQLLDATPVVLTYREYRMGHQIDGEELGDLGVWFSAVLDHGAPGAGIPLETRSP